MAPGPGASPLPQLQGRPMVTDGGLETEATDLDEGNPRLLAGQHALLTPLLPPVPVLGGCCGTDARHVAALWGADQPTQTSPE